MLQSTLQSALEQGARWLGRQAQRLSPVQLDNPFLQTVYAPVSVETTADKLQVKGTIPAELNGLLARIGPNPITPPKNPGTHHWFVGDGMVHGLRLADGEALWYRNRWVGTDTVNQILGKPRAPGPRKGVAEAVNTNIIGHGGRLWTLVEAGALPVEMDQELNTVKHGLFDSDRLLPFSAHPHLDPATGDLHAICYDALQLNRIYYQVIDKDCRLAHQVAIPVKHGPMIHDCAITATKVVVLDLPVTFSPKLVLRGASFPYQWNERHQARVGLLPHRGQPDQIRWFQLDPCFVFHTANAYDLEDGTVILDAVVHNRMFAGSIQGPDSQTIRFERWTLSPASDSVKREILFDLPQEFPRYDERLTGQPYRFAYGVGVGTDQLARPNELYRMDLKTGTQISHRFGPTGISAEAVFLPRKSLGAEDDGWLLSYVYDVATERSSVVILNADDLDGEPQAVVELPVRVPMGFHGNWIPSAH